MVHLFDAALALFCLSLLISLVHIGGFCRLDFLELLPWSFGFLLRLLLIYTKMNCSIQAKVELTSSLYWRLLRVQQDML